MKKITKHLLTLIAVCAFFLLAIASSDDTKKKKMNEKEVADKEAIQTTLLVTAKQLFADYNTNRVEGDQKYKDKLLIVTGIVDDIAKDYTDGIYVTVKGGQSGGNIQCFFSKDYINEAANQRKGQTITVKGNCEGKSIINVVLHDCVIQ